MRNVGRGPGGVIERRGLGPGDSPGLHLPVLIDPQFDAALEIVPLQTLG